MLIFENIYENDLFLRVVSVYLLFSAVLIGSQWGLTALFLLLGKKSKQLTT